MFDLGILVLAAWPLMCGAAVGWGMWRDQLAQLSLGSIPYLPGWQHRVRLWEGKVGQGHCPCALLGWNGAPGILQGPTCCPQGGEMVLCSGQCFGLTLAVTASPNPSTSMGGPPNTPGLWDTVAPSQSLMPHHRGPEL